MPTPLIGYTIASVAALKAIDGSNRTDGYGRWLLINDSGIPLWYTFVDASTATGDDFTVITPSDLPANGRWILTSYPPNGAANEWKQTQAVATEVVAFANPTAFDLGTSNSKRMLLTGNTSITYTNAKDATYTFEFDQGAGGFTISAGAGVVFSDDNPTQSVTANHINIFTCKYDPTDSVLRCGLANWSS